MTKINKAISYVRFSSAGQADGDSERRQLELAEKYALKHGLVIDRDLSFEDLAKSAYDKTNIDKGALGDFLKKVRAGKIPAGTTLLIENFDRLSRAIPLDALAMFTDIINADLIIVTLHDEQRFSRDALVKNPYLLFGVFIEHIRANSESKVKSDRVKGKWTEKQRLAKVDGKIMTKKTPYWIRAKADRSSFDLISERAEVVKWLVAESEKGTGNNTLIKQLHDRGIEAWSTSGKWQPSYVQKVLNNPALYGAIMVNDEIVPRVLPTLDR
jgi:DNA invertase Pin-like site-specific DNA recombinase